MNELILDNQIVQDKIYTIRGVQAILDEDLALLYGVETKVFNQAVKRNIERFPEKFRFQLTENEYENLRSQIVTSSSDDSLRSQIATLEKQHGGRRYLPYVFTEQGVSMLSTVLRSKTAIEEKGIPQKQHIFFDGQIFDAYLFVSDIIKNAKSSIKLIDNYIDASTLVLFTKRAVDVDMKIYTKTISKQLSLDIEKHNAQYPKIEIIKFELSHDRFLIIDDKEVYHFGASLKDLGKKWFAVSKMDISILNIMEKLK